MKNTIQVDNEVAKLILVSGVDGNLIAEAAASHNFKRWAEEFDIENYVISYDEDRDLLDLNRLIFRYFVTFQTEQEAVLLQ